MSGIILGSVFVVGWLVVKVAADMCRRRARLSFFAPRKTFWTASAARILAVLLALAAWHAEARGSTRKAYRHVKEGIQHYRAGDWKAAEKAFAEADVALPENERIAYDRACVYAARGDADKATELFRRAAMSRDARLAAGSHYNLGCVSAAKAKAVFGEKPEEASAEARAEGLQLVASAISHYRDCLEIEPDHSGARHNLEVLRLWIKHMQDTWAKRDRKKQRDELDLLAFLQMIEAQQTALRQRVKQLNTQQDSPRRRQAIKQATTEQVQLADEIGPLKEKIEQSLQPPPAAPGQPAPKPSDPEQRKQTLAALNGMADRAHAAMLNASDRLDDQDPADAVGNQAEALDSLNEIYSAVAPFQAVLQKATAAEDLLVNRSKKIVGQPKGEEANKHEEADKDVQPPDFPELARNQRRVEGWSGILPMKAGAELKRLEAAPSAPGSPKVAPAVPGSGPQQAEQAKAGLKKSLEKAKELGPKIQDLCNQAASSLEKEAANAALPKQEEALKLLKEIAESLPKQPRQNQGENDKQENKDQHPKPQPKPTGGDQRKRRGQRPQSLSQQQAEAVLRKVREREREHRERQKQLRRFLGGGVVVDKDW